jgi:peptidyl-prolyl cis-trans isomerase B (cyclophilin B)
VTSLKDRQRAAARAKLEREMATRQEQVAHRRQRRIWSLSAALAIVVVVGLVVVIVNATGHKAKSTTAAAASASPAKCVWTPNPNPSPSPSPTASTAPNKDLIKTGTPPTTGIVNSGSQNLVLNTNEGVITITMDLAKAPCAAASMSFLSSKKFYDNTNCDNLIDQGPYVLMCGDPSNKGDGGPNYSYTPENLPTALRPDYAEGDVAMLNNGTGNGSQFMFIYKDTPVQTDPSTGTETPAIPANFTIIGHVTGGMDLVTKIANGGANAANADGASTPKLPLIIKSTTVGPVAGS